MKLIHRYLAQLGVKVCIFIVATILLCFRLIGAEHWVIVAAGMASLREVGNWTYRKYGKMDPSGEENSD